MFPLKRDTPYSCYAPKSYRASKRSRPPSNARVAWSRPGAIFFRHLCLAPIRPSRMKEATSRFKINKLREEAGWRFFADNHGPATIHLELKVTRRRRDPDALGVNPAK